MRIGHRGCDGLRLICSARMACCCPEIGSTGGSHRLAEQSAQTACTSDTGSIGCLDDEINAAGIERLRQLRPTVDLDPEQAPIVKWAFEAYASGNYSTASLRDELIDVA